MSAVGVVNVKERLEKIKSTGYWRVNIRPTKFEKSRIDSRNRCWELVESCRVSLRGWDYPHLGHAERANGEDWIQSGADLDTIPPGHRVELWRFYQSGQFIHYFVCQEDYRKAEMLARIISDNASLAGSKDASGGLSILPTLYRVTEVFEFATRLALQERDKVLWPGLQISIKLAGMKNRQLFFWNPGRYLSIQYICGIDEITFEGDFSTEEIIAAGHARALDATTYIFETFGWNPSRQILAEEQRKLLEKRLD